MLRVTRDTQSKGIQARKCKCDGNKPSGVTLANQSPRKILTLSAPFTPYIVVNVMACHRHHHQNRQYHQMPRITYKTIIVRQIEQFLIAASLFELILDSPTDSDYDRLDSEIWRLKFEDSDDEHLAPLEMIEFCKTINPILPSIRYLAYRDQLSRSYHFFTSQVL
jgi:hypothetical protein